MVSGITVTISGNHVTLNGTKNTESAGGGGYLTDNAATLFVTPTTWYTFANATSLHLKVTYISGTATNTGLNSSCMLRKTDLSLLMGASWSNRSTDQTISTSASTPVYGLLFYSQTGDSYNNYQFDIEFSVNGTRWI